MDLGDERRSVHNLDEQLGKLSAYALHAYILQTHPYPPCRKKLLAFTNGVFAVVKNRRG